MIPTLNSPAIEEKERSEQEIVPFALAQPSRAKRAVFESKSLQPREEEVRAFLRVRGMIFSDDLEGRTPFQPVAGTIEVGHPTYCIKTIHKDTPVQTSVTLNGDFTPDSHDDPEIENEHDDDVPTHDDP